MHIFTTVCFHSSLNTFIVYAEVIWCLSLIPPTPYPHPTRVKKKNCRHGFYVDQTHSGS